MARYVCERCKADLFTTDPPHLCKDLAKRVARREKQIAVVLRVMKEEAPHRKNEELNNRIAERVVKSIVGMLAEDD